MAGWMLNCKEYAELTSQSMDRKLSCRDRISMKLHQVLCPPCKVIQEQFETIRSACRFVPSDDVSARLPEDTCERIKDAILKGCQDKDT